MNCPICKNAVGQLFSTTWGIVCRRCREAARAHERNPDQFFENRIRGMQLLSPGETKEQLRKRIELTTRACCQQACDNPQDTEAAVAYALERFDSIYPRTITAPIQN